MTEGARRMEPDLAEQHAMPSKAEKCVGLESCSGCWHYMAAPEAPWSTCEHSGKLVPGKTPSCDKWHDRRGSCQDVSCGVCGNRDVWSGLGLGDACDGCRAATDQGSCAVGYRSLGRLGKVCGGADVGGLVVASRQFVEDVDDKLRGELGQFKALLAGLLEESTELVSRGGVATYRMKLGVGDFVDLCRAAGVEL
jgi:hypothetical protein